MENSLSLFHKELYSTLLQNIDQKIKDDTSYSCDIHGYKTALQSQFSSSNLNIDEAICTYHKVIKESPEVCLENRLLKDFPPKKYPLFMTRGLPRVYKKDNLTESKVKDEFTNLPRLKTLGIEKFLQKIYKNISKVPEASISLITYVLNDGLGDLIAHNATLEILKQHFSNLTIHSIICLPQSYLRKDLPIGKNTIYLPYNENIHIEDFSQKALSAIEHSELVITIPTALPCLDKIKDLNKRQQFICLGEYGFSQSLDFSPISNHYALGLHFLEKGIFIFDKPSNPDFNKITNTNLLTTLFRKNKISNTDVLNYRKTNKLYFAYLANWTSGMIYLYALLEKEIDSLENIDICSPDLHWFIEFIDNQKRAKKPLLKQEFNIQELEIHFQSKIYKYPFQAKGKKLRVICPDHLKDNDFRTIMALSEPFVAVRGNLSVSMAISLNKAFFYDAPIHCKYFIKDLISLTENRIKNFPETLEIFHLMGQAFLHIQNEESQEWVDDTYFQPKQSLETIAKKLSIQLKKQQAHLGFLEINAYLRKDFNFKDNLIPMVTRSLIRYFYENFRRIEDLQIKNFASGIQPIEPTLKAIKEALYLETKS